ncbi:MAG: CRISPR-associated protein [Anaerolineae bacterium]|nr:CRISPR-associated protein [Anaerolineae bacterium]
MSYDLYVTYPCASQDDVNRLVGNTNLDIPTRIALLVVALTTSAKDYARIGDRRQGGGYKSLVFATDPAQTPYTQQIIVAEKRRLEQLELWQPVVPDFTALPAYSAFLQFQFTLASPYISRDDEIFHINDNPVRKDKVFKVPLVAGTAWKGNLRWTAIHLLVLRWHKTQAAEQLAEERFRLTLLFGDEVGEGENRGLAKYLDELSAEAATLYRQKVRDHFSLAERPPLPNHAGRLRFYPTFFDRVSLEVINPHDRTTRAGKQPIYFESVPAGANGVFSLLYVPFNGIAEVEAQADLTLIASAIREMMLTYGFSAKKSGGFGEAQDEINGQIATAPGPRPITKLSTLKDEVNHVQWG